MSIQFTPLFILPIISKTKSKINIYNMLPSTEHNPEQMCRYPSKKCFNGRALKRNGDLHNLCEHHRYKANRNQRKLERKRKNVDEVEKPNKSKKKKVLPKAINSPTFPVTMIQESIEITPLELEEILPIDFQFISLLANESLYLHEFLRADMIKTSSSYTINSLVNTTTFFNNGVQNAASL
jgi:hypothetical protein